MVHALQQGRHRVAHLHEEHADLLVVVAAFQIELDDDAERINCGY